MPDGTKYRSEASLYEGQLSRDWHDDCLNDNGKILGFAPGDLHPNQYAAVQLCPGELIVPSNFARLILNSEFSYTSDWLKAASTTVRVTFTDHKSHKEIL